MIETGDYQVVCQYFMKLQHSSKTWTKRMRFHAKEPYCWIDRAVTELSSRPAPTETRGRHSLAMSDEVRVKRLKVMRRRASIKQRLDLEIYSKHPDSGKVVHLVGMLDKTCEEIKELGGVPSNWSNKGGNGGTKAGMLL